jgi:hypothetical protein
MYIGRRQTFLSDDARSGCDLRTISVWSAGSIISPRWFCDDLLHVELKRSHHTLTKTLNASWWLPATAMASAKPCLRCCERHRFAERRRYVIHLRVTAWPCAALAIFMSDSTLLTTTPTFNGILGGIKRFVASDENVFTPDG